jgi:hypothetical protein
VYNKATCTRGGARATGGAQEPTRRSSSRRARPRGRRGRGGGGGGDSIRSMTACPRDMEVIWPPGGDLLFWRKRVNFAARLRDTQRSEARFDEMRPFQPQFSAAWRLGFFSHGQFWPCARGFKLPRFRLHDKFSWDRDTRQCPRAWMGVRPLEGALFYEVDGNQREGLRGFSRLRRQALGERDQVAVSPRSPSSWSAGS